MRRSLPSLYVWHGSTMFFGYLPNIETHAHHALQIEIGLYNPFVVCCGQEKFKCRFALIPPDLEHQIDDCDDVQVVIYLEPESIVGQRLKPFYDDGQIKTLEVDMLNPLLEVLRRFSVEIHTCHEAGLLLRAILEILPGDNLPPPKKLDQRIKKALDICRTAPDKKIATNVLAKKVGLSQGRLIHLFKDQVGVPIRRYLLWARLSDALMHLSKGGSFTQAAHRAGFADSAHLSRTYRRMYGNSPNDLLRNSQFVQAVPCFM